MKRYKGIQRVAVITFFVSMAILMWVNLDGEIVEEIYYFPEKNIELESNLDLVNELAQLSDHYQLRLRYLKQPWYGDDVVIQLILEEKAADSTGYQGSYSNASILLKTRMEMEASKIEPGEAIILPLKLPQGLDIRWSIKAVDAHLSRGRIWLSIAPARDEMNLSTFIPLMIIPVNFQFRTILGITTDFWKWFLSGIGIFSLIVMIFCKIRDNSERE